MASMFGYLIEVLLCSGLFVALYRLLLARRINYTLCRRYLVGTMLLAAIIPALELPLYPAESAYSPLPIFEIETAEVIESEQTTLPAEESFHEAWRTIIIGGYFTISVLLLALLAIRLLSIARLRSKAQLTHGAGYTLAESDAVKTPFSFWRTIFLALGYEASERRQIIAHERSHIRHQHTADRLIMEFMRTLFWCNPFLWLAERWLIDVQEWQADADVLAEGTDLHAYQATIFKQLFGYNPDITCGLSNSFTKNRFLMMTQQPRGGNPLLRLGVALPLIAGMILAFGATAAVPTLEEQPNTLNQTEEQTTARLEVLGKRYRFNGEVFTKEELPAAIERFREGLNDPTKAVVHISATPETKLGAVQDAKEILRQSKVLRIRYEEMGYGAQVLPPRATNESKQIEQIETRIKQRNHFQINLNANGKLLCGTQAKLQMKDGLEGVCDYLKRFVMNPTGVLELSEQEDRVFTLADGRAFTLPVSKGIITIQTSANVAAKDYFALTHAIAVAYGEMRNELAEQLFKRPMQELSQAEQELIHRAIPIRVSEGMVKVREF